jgi:hypothetical protein
MICSLRHPKHTRVIATWSSFFMGKAYGTDATVPVASKSPFPGIITGQQTALPYN